MLVAAIFYRGQHLDSRGTGLSCTPTDCNGYLPVPHTIIESPVFPVTSHGRHNPLFFLSVVLYLYITQFPVTVVLTPTTEIYNRTHLQATILDTYNILFLPVPRHKKMTIRTYHRPVKTSEVVVVSLTPDHQRMAGQGQGKGSSPPPKSGGQYQQPPQSQQQQIQRQQTSGSAGKGPSSTVDPSLLKYTGEQRILELNRRELEKASSGDTGDHVRHYLFFFFFCFGFYYHYLPLSPRLNTRIKSPTLYASLGLEGFQL